MAKDVQEILADFQRMSGELESLKQSDPQKYITVCEAVTEEISRLNEILAKP